MTDLQRRVVALLPGPRTRTGGGPDPALTPAQLADAMGERLGAVQDALEQLRRDGLATSTERGYRRTQP
jgi:hypothetical protein